MTRKGLLLAVAVIMFFSEPLWAWGKQGHEAIAGLAWELLSPKAKEHWQKVLGPDQSLVSVSTWADQIRHLRPNTSSWHWITLQINDNAADAQKADSPNVVTEIMRLSPRLKPGSDKYAREEALKWMVHLIGDLHQPLHTGEMQDRGGNDTWVRVGRRKTKLHQVWDDGLISRFKWNTAEWTRHLQDTLKLRLSKNPQWQKQIVRGNAYQWANETHALARLAYDLGQGRRIAARGRVITIEKEYYEAHQPVVFQQILKAGIRLAATLEAGVQRGGEPVYLATPKQVEKKILGDLQGAVSKRKEWVWSKASHVYHLSTCPDVKRISPHNLEQGIKPPAGRHAHKGCIP